MSMDDEDKLPLDQAVDWHFDGTPITYRECIQNQCGTLALTYAQRIQELALAYALTHNPRRQEWRD